MEIKKNGNGDKIRMGMDIKKKSKIWVREGKEKMGAKMNGRIGKEKDSERWERGGRDEERKQSEQINLRRGSDKIKKRVEDKEQQGMKKRTVRRERRLWGGRKIKTTHEEEVSEEK